MAAKITRVVEELVSADPCLSYALTSGVINYSALAAKIRPAVEELYGAAVRENTVVQALRRISKEMALTDYSLVAQSIASANYHIIQGMRERVLPVSQLAEVFSTHSGGAVPQDSTVIAFVADGVASILGDEKFFSLIGRKEGEEEFTLLKIVLKGVREGLPGSAAYLAQVLGNNNITPRNIIRRGNQLFVVFRRSESEALFRAIQVLQRPTSLALNKR